MKPSASETVVCTIVSKNYLHHARTLMDSLRRVHPEWSQHVLLVDELAGEFDPAAEAFRVRGLAELALPEARKFLFRYDILELNTAVKPWFLERLFAEPGVRKVVYLDPDIFVYQPLVEVERLLDGGALMTLTPHLTGQLDDGNTPSEHDILKSGCYNLGFIALARHPQLDGFLKWWQSKLQFDCRVSLAENLFVDQRWMDLAPGIFDDVRVLRHEGYNVAYWNLKHRNVARRDGELTVNGTPLVFFHFSGLDVNWPSNLSKHQNRHRLRDLPVVAELVRDYSAANRANGSAVSRQWSYAFGTLADGTPIPPALRRLYRSQSWAQQCVGDDPFAHSHQYANRPWGTKATPLVTHLMRQIWEARPDLQSAFPDIDTAQRLEFVHWFLHDEHSRATTSRRFFDPVEESLDKYLVAERQDTAISLAPCPHPQTIAAQTLRSLIRWAYFHSPYQPSEAELRAVYRFLKPAIQRLPSSLRLSGLKADARRWHAQRRLRQWRSERDRPLVAALSQWLKRLFARNASTDEPAAPARENIPSDAAALETANPAPVLHHDFSGRGLDIVGYVRSEHGVGQSVRSCASAALAAGLPITLHDFNAHNLCRTEDRSFDRHLATERRNRIAVVHVNADQTPLARQTLGDDFFRGGYTVGVWYWELPVFPERWLDSFDLVDEIWAPSRFVRDALQPRASCPIPVMPLALSCAAEPGVDRSAFGLPDDRFLFLTMYDALSLRERKNPEAAIAAYRQAFPKVGKDVGLVLKVNNGHHDRAALAELRARLADRPDIVVIDRTLTRQEVYNLEAVCDAFVSLHRSEGFGLGLAEAMLLGKPAVGTNWSGNLEFMNEENSCLVDYRLVRIERDIGPYSRGQLWADASVDHAAALLKRLVDDPAYRARIAAKGQQTIRESFSPEVVGGLYRERIAAIAESLNSPSTRIAHAA